MSNSHLYQAKKRFGSDIIEFYVGESGETEFLVNDEFELLDSSKRHPGVCKFLIRCFNEASSQIPTMWATALDGDEHERARAKAYARFFPHSLMWEGITVYYKGDPQLVRVEADKRYS